MVKRVFCKAYLLLIILSNISLSVYSQKAVEKDLSFSSWKSSAGEGTEISLKCGDSLVAQVDVHGSTEGFPHISLTVNNEDWRGFQKIAFDVKLESSLVGIQDCGKDFVAVLNDKWFINENIAGISPVNQEISIPHIDCGEWQSVEIDIRNIARKQVSALLLYFYDRPFNFDHSYKVTIRNIRIIGADSSSVYFDGVDYHLQKMPTVSSSAFSSVSTVDFLDLNITRAGTIHSISIAGDTIGVGAGQSSGIMLRDACSPLPPVIPEGELSTIPNGILQKSEIKSLGCRLDAKYETLHDRIKISGTVTSMSRKDKAVTIYIALPVDARKNWIFHKSLIHKTTPFVDGSNISSLEEISQDYPVVVLSDELSDHSFAFILDQAKPISYRIGVNPRQQLFYIAFDVTLLNQQRFDGSSQNRVDFQVELVRTDAKWGFRSGLEKLYTLHPDYFIDRVGHGGGWELYTRSQFNYTNEQNIAGGYRFDWGAVELDREHWEQNVHNGFLNFLYIEPEYMQFSMGDFREPTVAMVEQRFKKLIANDDIEWKQFKKLRYSRSSRKDLHRLLCAANVSGVHDKKGNIVWNLGNREWIGDLRFGSMISCNLSPHIPGGRGTVAREILMDAVYNDYIDKGWTAPHGFGLDEFMMSPNDYRRENFKYMETSISFDPETKQPMIVRGFSSIEWLKRLRKDYEKKSCPLLLFANCKGQMTYVSPYLDIFGIEDTYVIKPEYYRAIAGKKRAITNVSYAPPSKENLEYNMLWGIYVGRNAAYDVLSPIVKMLDKLYSAGWEPITAAVSETSDDASDIRLERYGNEQSDTVYFVVHNMGVNQVDFSLYFDSSYIGKRTQAQIFNDGEIKKIIVEGCKVPILLGNRETKVIALTY